MTKYPHLKNAPIKEALIDIQVELPDSVDLEEIEAYQEKLGGRYPSKKKSFRAVIQFLPNQPPRATENMLIGWKFRNKDSDKIAQARLDGFTFSQLTPYRNWESLRDEARELWDIYKDSYFPRTIKRVALRYINEIKIELPTQLNLHLTAPPYKPVGAPENIASFLNRSVFPYEEIESFAIVTQALEKIQDEGSLSIIVDIDVFREASLDPNTDEIWDLFEKFREIKNDLFFGSITTATQEAYL